MTNWKTTNFGTGTYDNDGTYRAFNDADVSLGVESSLNINNGGSIMMVKSEDTTGRPAVTMFAQAGFAFFTRTEASADYDFYLDNVTGNDIKVYMLNLATGNCTTVNINAGKSYHNIVLSGSTTHAYIFAWTSINTV